MKTDWPKHRKDKKFFNPFEDFKRPSILDYVKWRALGQDSSIPEDAYPRSVHLGLEEPDIPLLLSNNQDLAVTWVGHSTVLIKMHGVTILTDPNWSQFCPPRGLGKKKRAAWPAISFDCLVPIDMVLISHDHYGHLDQPTIKALTCSPSYLIPLGVGPLFEKIGNGHYCEMDWGQSRLEHFINFTAMPAQHSSGRRFWKKDRALWLSWMITSPQYKILFVGDSGYFPAFKEIGARFGPFDLAILPIGGYLPRRIKAPYHLSPAQALDAWQDLGAEFFLPVHHYTFRSGDDPVILASDELEAEIARRGLDREKIWLSKPGRTYSLSK